MKKIIKNLVITLFLSSFAIALANSGPVYWQGYPSSDIMTVDKNSPIRVKGENLTFDFSKESMDSYSIEGNVKAEYEMNNPTEETLTIKMAFPFVGRLNNINYQDIQISSDGIELPYEIYLGKTFSGDKRSFEEVKTNFDFDEIVKKISQDTYIANNFTENEMGKLYYMEIKPTTDEGVDFTVDFDLDHEKTNILIKNFNSFKRRDGHISLGCGTYGPQIAEIYLLGEDIDLSIKGYTIGSSEEETDLFTYEILEKEVDLITYLFDFIKSNEGANFDHISNIQLYNLYAQALDWYFTNNLGLCTESDIFAESYSKRIISLVYDVEFPPSSDKRVSVSYKTSGTMDRRNTSNPLYSFDYIINPAENWDEFKDLNIKIITPQEAPYIIQSSILLNKQGSNTYTASLESLPEDDLSFTLYSKEKITFPDKIGGRLWGTFGYFAPILVGIAGIVIIIIIAILFKVKKKR